MIAMQCIPCQKDVQPYIDLTEKGVPMHVCPICNVPMGLATTDRLRPAPAVTAQMPNAGPQLAPGPSIPDLLAPTPQPKTGDRLQPIDPMAQVRVRLAAVDAELQRCDGLRQEAHVLRAMLAAAERATKPRRRKDAATLQLPGVPENVVHITTAKSAAAE